MKTPAPRFNPEALAYAPRGGLGKMHELFGERLNAVIEELKKELTA